MWKSQNSAALPPAPRRGQLTPLRLAMQAHRGPIRLLHIDCDLYSSTRDALRPLAENPDADLESRVLLAKAHLESGNLNEASKILEELNASTDPRSATASSALLSDDGKQDDEDDWLEGTSMGPAGGGASRAP